MRLGKNDTRSSSTSKPVTGSTLLRKGKVITVRESGDYPSTVSKIELGQRPNPWQNNRNVPCFRFEFSPDGMKNGETPFLIQTATDYGSPSALCTQVIDSIIGRHLEDGEIERLEVARLVGQRVIVTNDKVTPEDSEEPTNRIEALQREDSEPLDLKPLLLKGK